MGLIMNGGSAKSAAFDAINAAKKGDFKAAAANLKEADDFIVKAHNAQTGLLSKEARGEKIEVNLLLIHAQDHLMTAITFRDLAGEIVDLYKRLAEK